MRILLADEDAMIGDRVRSALKHEGFAVDAAPPSAAPALRI